MFPRASSQTRRQELVEMLGDAELSFDELRRELGVAVRLLEDDLRHVERSHHRGPQRLLTTPPSCDDCGFVFRGRAPRRYHTPSRCPKCRGERILPARLRIG